MDKFTIKLNILKLIKEEQKIWAVICLLNKFNPTQKNHSPSWFTDDFLQTSEEETGPLSYKLFQRMKKKKYFLTQKPDKEIKRKKSYGQTSCKNLGTKS